ncbi:hypothetical protein D9757_001740 [Collybiopsis confluens]|uniref:Piwi domain-containing protein n=1 Tax=Collybiopsis confluens TaxID=2823264 RepID=A0A8H5HYQ4_9AGAR|nr:hypothetical protein D9757_001740 [Collybiopsis confluens]
MSMYPGRARGDYQGRGNFRGGPRGSRGRGGGGGPPPPMVNRDQPLNVTVIANCFAVKKLPEKEYFLYDAFFPEVKGFPRRQELFERLQSVIAPDVFVPRALYDGKALAYSPRDLETGKQAGQGLSFLVGWSDTPPRQEKPGVYRIILKATTSNRIRPKDLVTLIKDQNVVNNPQAATALNILNLLIRQDSNRKYPHNASKFFSKVGKLDLPGIELWRGYFQSARPTRDNILINIDTTMAAVIKGGSLLGLCMDYLKLTNTRELRLERTSARYHTLEKFLRRVKVTTRTSPNRVKTVHGLVPEADNFAFSKDGQNMTVSSYLLNAYQIRLAHTGIVGIRLSKPGAERDIVAPLEICNVQEGQFYKQKLPDIYTADAVKFACLRPAERLSAITGKSSNDIADSPIRHYHQSESIIEAGLEIDPDPINIRGQLLALPKIKFKGNDLTPANGSWNVVNRSLFKPSSMKFWGVVNFVERPGSMLEQVVRSIMSCGSKLGMSMFLSEYLFAVQVELIQLTEDVTHPAVVESGSGQAAEMVLNRAMATMRNKCGAIESQPLLVILLPQNAADVRQRVKFWSDTSSGVLTQCLREGKLRKANDQYFNNIALKLNARLDGVNFVVESPAMNELRNRGPFIIMGADVAHPGPGVPKPSTTSLVWSDDFHAAHYNAIIKIQPPRLEIIQDLHKMVYEAVFRFGSKHGSPTQIIFFRDGVSEGEFEKVANNEIYDIKAAIETLWKEKGIKDPKPKLTHHILFFPQENSPANDGKGNCVAGFVSNQEDLSHPSTTDFYLQSHSAIQGTSRSGHYTVIRDEIFDLNVEKIQGLAFSLCHVYAKATRSVSIPAPVYYADLACARSEFHYVPGTSGAMSDSASVSSGNGGFILDEWQMNFKPAKGVSNMYFL